MLTVQSKEAFFRDITSVLSQFSGDFEATTGRDMGGPWLNIKAFDSDGGYVTYSITAERVD